MIYSTVFKNLIIVFFLLMELESKSAFAQEFVNQLGTEEIFTEYNNLKLRNVENISMSKMVSKPTDLIFFPLSPVEDELAKNLQSHWIWSENTLNTIDSYSGFLFQTKKSSKFEEVSVLLQINFAGKLSGVKILSDVDRGLEERLDYVLRKLPYCKPVPGFETYGMQTFEIIIKKL